ncbi:restriction endonuclease subunit S [bacterium]|nr:restriction endonuclease subunit S [bacterium]
MSEWKKVKIGDVCRIEKGTTGIASAEPGKYPLVVTAEERKTCLTYQFDCEAVCIPLVSSSGHGKKSLKNVHYQSGKFALGTILCAIIPNNPQELDARYLHQYLQFYKDIILVPLMKGAANVSLSMKDIATVEFPMPPIERQKELSNLFVSLQEKHKELSAEFEKQTEYAKLLRQNILQDAIEGKLTADWRKDHPVIKGDPDHDAETLFEQIQKERNAEKKQKKLAPITDEEKPFEIPESWKWVRLNDICSNIVDCPHTTPLKSNEKTQYPCIRTSEIQNGEINWESMQYIDYTEYKKRTTRLLPKKNDIVYAREGAFGDAVLLPEGYNFSLGQRTMLLRVLVNPKYVLNSFLSPFLYAQALKQNRGATVGHVNVADVKSFTISLPPLKEQEEIVNKVEHLLAKVTELENQIAERETYTKQLMQSILKDAFGEETPKRQNDALDVALDGAKN